jgi:mercuric ion transport protein
MSDSNQLQNLSQPIPRAQGSFLKPGWLASGGLIGAGLASSCCILPLALFSLGIGGAWVGNLTVLAPYQPIFVVLSLGFLGGGFWRVYRRPAIACAPQLEGGETCATPQSNRVTKVALWLATVLVGAALAFPYAAPILFGN